MGGTLQWEINKKMVSFLRVGLEMCAQQRREQEVAVSERRLTSKEKIGWASTATSGSCQECSEAAKIRWEAFTTLSHLRTVPGKGLFSTPGIQKGSESQLLAHPYLSSPHLCDSFFLPHRCERRVKLLPHVVLTASLEPFTSDQVPASPATTIASATQISWWHCLAPPSLLTTWTSPHQSRTPTLFLSAHPIPPVLMIPSWQLCCEFHACSSHPECICRIPVWDRERGWHRRCPSLPCYRLASLDCDGAMDFSFQQPVVVVIVREYLSTVPSRAGHEESRGGSQLVFALTVEWPPSTKMDH